MKTEMKMFASLPLYIVTTLLAFGYVSALPGVFRQDPRIQPSVREKNPGILPKEPEQDPEILPDEPKQDRRFLENIEDSTPGRSCPYGWTRFNSYCYKVGTSVTSWDQAQLDCKSRGAGLVKINGAEENDFVLDLSKQQTSLEKVWIGLTWYTGDDFYWYDYSAPAYTNWAPDQPNGGAKEPCGSMYTQQKMENLPIAAAGYWNDVKCNGVSRIGYVCKMLP